MLHLLLALSLVVLSIVVALQGRVIRSNARALQRLTTTIDTVLAEREL